MESPSNRSWPTKNLLLDSLSGEVFRRLSPALQPVSLPFKQLLYRTNSPIDFAYFPTGGVVSAMVTMEDGSGIEVATIGREGMVGLTALLGVEKAPCDYNVQIEGNALKIRLDVLRREAGTEGEFRQVLTRYSAAYHTQAAFSVACNGLHTVQKRCCRWLLTTADRLQSDVLPLTHEFLGVMLGVRRSSVSEVLRIFQDRGIVRSVRGKIEITDRPALEALCCECYRRTQEKYAELFDAHWAKSRSA